MKMDIRMKTMIRAEKSRTQDLRKNNDTQEVQTQSQLYCAHAIVYSASLMCWLKTTNKIISPYRKETRLPTSLKEFIERQTIPFIYQMQP